ncbi:MAG: TrmO family methyltransferase, partial [Dehalococcoidales bacterium]|nr:TrmO family methyltransferase [Dehalococcoidales bacterium]
MMDKLAGIKLKTIGIVRSEVKQPTRQDCTDISSDIIIDSRLTDALDNLDDFSHIIVLYWMHCAVDKPLQNKLHPMGIKEIPLVGLFATRSPNRPNP